ncbi:hypothetical protein ABIS04_16405 [Shewanella sp. H8]|uniref:hypothetical protein n=1 Tax=Shewanella sp. H8 TaxID=3342676 RepID=UPI0033154F12
MMNQLTPKQITARAYYRENREYILARCRAKYHESVGNNVPDFVSKKVMNKKPQPVSPAPKVIEQPKQFSKADIEWDGQLKGPGTFNGVINDGNEFKDRKTINKAISDQGKAKAAARRKTEDMKLARELGLSLEDLA